MSYFVYVDNSNVWIEGKRVAAVRTGMVANIQEALRLNVKDDSYRLDTGRLLHFSTTGDIGRAVLFGSTPPPEDSIWRAIEQQGWELVLNPRNVKNKEKKVDTSIASHMMRDAYTLVSKDSDTVIVVAGDGDHVPAVELLVKDGFKVEVMFWSHASSGELRRSGAKFIELDQHFDFLKR